MIHCALSLCRLFEEGSNHILRRLSTAFQHLANGHSIFYKVRLESWMIHCALSLCRLFEEGSNHILRRLSTAFQHLANGHSIFYKVRLE
ncbi:hypothetical protein A0J61_10683 [Choanephora cucurbitarum]|uniref:Uncharacterized protein n=1 Tax=Choanephora cucurbitarum TaxID=101091 RepID=A0A1C7MY00_9FUNG|nr:hypothetical protein A0J61_10683 [Choanephora cucurbitarum]